MPINFTLPTKTQHYDTGLLQSLRDHQAALAQWLDPAVAGTVTSQPTGAYRLNTGNVERYNGSSWVGQSINGLSFASGVASFALSANTLNSQAVRGGSLNIGAPSTAGSALFVNTPSLNTSFASGLGVEGSYTNPGGVGTSVVNLHALGVRSGGGYDSHLVLSTTSGMSIVEGLRVTPSGVGIGRSPVNALDVKGAVVSFWDAVGTNYLSFAPAAAGNASQINGNGGLSLRAGGSEAINIATTLNVGMGAAASASARLTLAAADPTRGILEVLSNSAGSSGAQLQLTQVGVADWAFGQPPGTNAFAFWQGRNTTADGTEHMRLNATGLGIKTSNPGTALDVAGTGRFTAANSEAARLLSGASGSNVSLALGRTALEHYIGAAAATNNFASGSAAGDMVLNTSGKMVLGTGGVGRVFVASAGVTMPQQPSVSAARSTAQTSGNVLIFDAEEFDVGGAYNAATGVFTAPAAGKYLVAGKVRIVNTTGALQAVSIQLRKNGASFIQQVAADSLDTGDSRDYAIGVGVVQLAAGDTLDLQSIVTFSSTYTLEVFSRLSIHLIA